MALNSIHFSFNRNKNLVTECRFHLLQAKFAERAEKS